MSNQKKSPKGSTFQKGFTLIEAVICVALIGLISLGFLQMTVGSVHLLKTGRTHSQASSALVSAVEDGTLPTDMAERTLGQVDLNLSNDNSGESSEACPDSDAIQIELDEMELYYPTSTVEGTLTYYR